MAGATGSVESFWQGLKFSDEHDRRRLAHLDGPQARSEGDKQGYGATLNYDGHAAGAEFTPFWDVGLQSSVPGTTQPVAGKSMAGAFVLATKMKLKHVRRNQRFVSKGEIFAASLNWHRAILAATSNKAGPDISDASGPPRSHSSVAARAAGRCWQNSFHKHPSFFSHVPSKVMQPLGETNVPLEHCRRAAGVGQSKRKQCSHRANLSIVRDPIERPAVLADSYSGVAPDLRFVGAGL